MDSDPQSESYEHETGSGIITKTKYLIQRLATLLLNIGVDNSGSLGAMSENDNSEASIVAECDIGKMLNYGIDLHCLGREEKYRILKREPTLHPSAYPRTCPYASGPFRQFQPSWLVQYPWLHYSPFCDGAFCRACAFFAPEKAGGQVLGQFVTKPFKSWVNQAQKNDQSQWC